MIARAVDIPRQHAIHDDHIVGFAGGEETLPSLPLPA